MDVAVNGLSIDALEAQLKEFEPETIMVERVWLNERLRVHWFLS